MSDSELLPPRPPIPFGVVPSVNLSLQINRIDMTDTAATAITEAARLTHTEPAKESTKQTLIQSVTIALCVAGGFVVIALHPEAAPSVAAILAVLGGGSYAVRAVDRWRR